MKSICQSIILTLFYLVLGTYLIIACKEEEDLAPIANFSVDKFEGEAPCTVTFTNSSKNADTYLWDFGDGQSSTETDPSHTYEKAGTYRVELTAQRGNQQDKKKQVIPIVIVAPALVADFTADKAKCQAPCTVTFTNRSENADTYLWDFGDGKTSTEANPSHTYQEDGNYTVKLNASQGNQQDEKNGNPIKVEAPAPVADFTADKTECQAPCKVTFTNTSENADIFHWDFGDGQTSTESDPSHTYQDAGSYTVKLVAWQGNQQDEKSGVPIKVEVPAPVADFTADKAKCQAPCKVTFTNRSEHADTYLWDFGDGKTSTEANPSHTYQEDGNYTVKLVASQGDQQDEKSGEPIRVEVPAPEANYTADKTECEVPCTVTFTNRSEHADTYLWDFGDGQTSTEANPSHTYQEAGNYIVKLNASQGNQQDEKNGNPIKVEAPAPVADFTADKAKCQVPCTVTFINRSENADTYLWDFGNGKTSTKVNPSHTYQEAGNYIVTLKASKGDQQDEKSGEPIKVEVPAPIADFTADKTKCQTPCTVTFTNTSEHADTYHWDFGDGQTSTESDPSHTYQVAGNYTVKLVALQGDQQDEKRGDPIKVKAPAPIADFIADKTECEAPCTVTFTNRSEHADTYLWDFGDGQSSTESDPSHTYQDAGSYTVKLVASQGNQQDEKSGNPIKVKAPPPPFEVTQVTASVVGNNDFVGECPYKFTFQGRITVNQAGTVKYRWLRSDGAATELQTLTFSQAGSQDVFTSWKLGAAGQTYNGLWQQLKIIEPAEKISNKVTFSLKCAFDPVMLFIGEWINEDANTGGITKVSIRKQENTLYVHMWGKCSPIDCDWGEIKTAVADASDQELSIKWDQGFVIRKQKIKYFDVNRLEVKSDSHYIDNSGRPDKKDVYYFIKN